MEVAPSILTSSELGQSRPTLTIRPILPKGPLEISPSSPSADQSGPRFRLRGSYRLRVLASARRMVRVL